MEEESFKNPEKKKKNKEGAIFSPLLRQSSRAMSCSMRFHRGMTYGRSGVHCIRVGKQTRSSFKSRSWLCWADTEFRLMNSKHSSMASE